MIPVLGQIVDALQTNDQSVELLMSRFDTQVKPEK